MATRKPKGATAVSRRPRAAAKKPRVSKASASGRASQASATEAPPRRRYAEKLINVTTTRIDPGATRAAGARATVSIAKHRDDVVEVVLDNGVHFFTRFDQFRADYRGAPTREAVDGEFIVPTVLSGPDADRGIGTWTIKALRFLGIDPLESAARLTAREVCEWYEQKQLYRESSNDTDTQRLWQVVPGDEFKLRPIASPITGTQPVLVFLHGTASSSRGSFGELWTPAARDIRHDIVDRYGDRVYAFEHYSLTQSPMRNALALLSSLPDGACLHLISHSRGGLVGELLCRAQVIDRDPFEADEIALFSGKGYEEQRAELSALNDVLKKKKLRVERFARVACPARGTTLASARLDRWLSVALDLVGEVADLASSGFYDVFAEFVKAFIHTRAEPDKLPGLEAMMPTSPLVRLLNRADVQTSADLHVVAGDIQGGSILRRLGILLTDLYYREDHDLIVNTRAMYGGTPRIAPPRRFVAQGPDVYHFSYFRNRPTAQKVAAALHQPPAQDGFEVFDQKVSAGPRGFRSPAAVSRGAPDATKPIVVVLPGIMGSLLDVNGARVWMDIGALNRGRMESLAIDATGVAATGLIEDAYASMIAFLERTHEVVPFPFDWRLSLRDEAKRLAGALGPWLDEADRRGQPLSIIAHSLGGLLARVMIADHPKTWERIIGKPQGRLLQLGTPNGGSYSIPLMLVGREETVQKLALLDIKHTLTYLLGLIAAFPGVLEMLPAHATPDFFDASTWARLQALDGATGGFWHPPDPAALRAANAVRTILDGSTPNLDRVVYVAGCAPNTPCKLNLARPPASIGGPEQSEFATQEYYFEATSEGDGRVPWATGILTGLRPWYMNAVHGDLAATPRYFDALHDLLTTGTTERLPTAPPATAKRGVATAVYRSAAVEYVPDAVDFEATAMGRQRQRPVVRERGAAIDVIVTQGNLVFSNSPVFVGHYAGDAIISAEAQIDRQMQGRLVANYQLGLYPDRINTAKVFLGRPDAAGRQIDFPGAIVAGLGAVGELAPANLASTFEHAVLAYVVALLESDSQRADGGPTEARITTLLIGTGWNAMAVRDSVAAILRGALRASAALARSEYKDRVRITQLEFMEMYEDRAIQAVRALRNTASDAELSGGIRPDMVLRRIAGGRARAFFEDEGPWWHRLQIVGDEGGALKFTMLTDRARAETTLQPTQRALVEAFVERQIATTDSERQLAVTLFELLLPNGIKDRAPEGRDLVLVLDEQTAGYPWELLQDGAVPADADPGALEQARIALRAGLVRQLSTQQFRPSVTQATGRNALVVGDPKIDSDRFPDLPGALREAETVESALSDAGSASYDVKLLSMPDAELVIQALFDRPYRIVHLAGHGVYEYEVELTAEELRRKDACEPVQPRKVTGMVLGNGMFLTPAEIAQMRAVPELVFINCCHLGRTSEKVNTGSRHLLAANLATEFIRMGVKVVVAAGWAVNDAAAATFAKTFYEQLLSGAPFGRAVHAARRRTASDFPAYNTWGAYQCYGDYEWRLETEANRGGQSRTAQFASPSELVIELSNIASDAQSARPQDLEGLNSRVDALLEVVSSDRQPWLGLAEVRAAFANVLGELDRFDIALANYEQALAAKAADFPVRAVEQYANLLTRAAVFEVRAAAKRTGSESAKRQQAARKNMDRAFGILTSLASFAKTPERLSLLGSAWKRRALVEQDPKVRQAALVQMRQFYWDAHQAALNSRGGIDPYPLLNWMAAVACLPPPQRPGVGAAASPMGAELAALLAQLEQQLRKATDRDFWGIVQHADLELIRPLLASRFDAAARDAVIKEYRRASTRAGSPRQLRSVVEHVEFLAAIFSGRTGAAAKRTATLLEECVRELQDLMQGSAGVASDASPQDAPPIARTKPAAKRGKTSPSGDRRRSK
ncbi:MAG: CHAT domain-containing protein [Casimicrobiaceae bacterium]